MAKYQNDLMLDAAFDWIRARVTQMTVCNAQPTTYAQATSTFKLADVALTSSGITVSNGDASGRKMRMSSKTGVTVDASGTASHIALAGSTGATVLLFVTTCTTQVLTSGNTVSLPGWDDEIADAA